VAAAVTARAIARQLGVVLAIAVLLAGSFLLMKATDFALYLPRAELGSLWHALVAVAATSTIGALLAWWWLDPQHRYFHAALASVPATLVASALVIRFVDASWGGWRAIPLCVPMTVLMVRATQRSQRERRAARAGREDGNPGSGSERRIAP
jgi:hypothetical protein